MSTQQDRPSGKDPLACAPCPAEAFHLSSPLHPRCSTWFLAFRSLSVCRLLLHAMPCHATPLETRHDIGLGSDCCQTCLAASAGQRSSIRALLLRGPPTSTVQSPAHRPLHVWSTVVFVEPGGCPSPISPPPGLRFQPLAPPLLTTSPWPSPPRQPGRRACFCRSKRNHRRILPKRLDHPPSWSIYAPKQYGRPPRYSFSNAMQRLRRSLFPHYSTPSHPACVTRGGPEPPSRRGGCNLQPTIGPRRG